MTILLVCAFVVTTSDMAECLTSSKEKRKSTEKLKAQNYDDLIVGEYNSNKITDEEYEKNKTAKILKDAIEEGYSLKVTIKNYNTPEENGYDLVKIITVKVEYKVGKNTENVELKTTVTREN